MVQTASFVTSEGQWAVGQSHSHTYYEEGDIIFGRVGRGCIMVIFSAFSLCVELKVVLFVAKALDAKIASELASWFQTSEKLVGLSVSTNITFQEIRVVY